ncbi:MAG: ABC transporter substrate-binding protein [Pseudomonadales bacterium]|nr:ABC transporter substrate-binding protein [Pseudomonadales bacterium]MBO6701797.1 ABC transporter substrate-binding protein [Pseudomonadales bacterium]MBO7005512.1 ABC transporter substrate-binding protein [Pseudomonadales bacterium]
MQTFLKALVAAAVFFSSTAYADDTCFEAKDASRIAIAGGSITEVIYFLGEESRIIATDRTSNFPEEATKFPSVGYVRSLSAEGILSLKPSLVLGEDDMGPEEIVTQLAATSVDIRKLSEAHTTQGVLTKIRCIGSILGVESKAEARISEQLESDLNELQVIAATQRSDKPRVALLLMFAEGSPIIAGHDTSGDGVLAMAGAANAFAAVEGWKPVSLEAMVKANPDHLIITARGFGAAGGLDGLKENPALRLTKAVTENHIHVIDGMALLGFGPRTLSTAVSISESLSVPE